jgi:MYXO-CTERM domain-containing protein
MHREEAVAAERRHLLPHHGQGVLVSMKFAKRGAEIMNTLHRTVATAGVVALAAGVAQAAVITGVSDNDGGTYTVVQDGLSDGVSAFSNNDSPEWSNVPSFLNGADYIRTDNGDNSNSDLEVFVELDQPSILYVFHSDNVADPSWLTSNFMDTGDDLILDVDGDDDDDDDGDDDNVTYSIFSASFDGMGSITADLFDNDPNTTNSEEMYGIAAVVPAPGVAALLGLGGLAGIRRRR